MAADADVEALGPAVVDDSDARQGRRKKALASIGEVALYAGGTYVSRVAVWAFVGFGLASVLLGVQLASGALDFEHDQRVWIVVAIALVELVVGIAAFAFAGHNRALGRIVIYVLVKKGIATYAAGRILQLTVDAVKKTNTGAKVADAGQSFVENLPLQQAEDALKNAVGRFTRDGELEEGTQPGLGRRILRKVNAVLCARIETYLLAVFRKEATASGGGGISLAKVRDRALEPIDDVLTDVVEGAMRKQTLLMTAVVALVCLLPPVVVWGLSVSG